MIATKESSTNDDKPFEQWERIEYCDDHFVVLANYGRTGRVSVPGEGKVIDPFYWTFEGVACTRVAPDDAK